MKVFSVIKQLYRTVPGNQIVPTISGKNEKLKIDFKVELKSPLEKKKPRMTLFSTIIYFYALPNTYFFTAGTTYF